MIKRAKKYWLVPLFLISMIFSCKRNKDAEVHFERDDAVFSISQGESFLAKFAFANIGADTLKVITVTGDCSCTNIEYDKRPIPPGGSGNIVVKFNSEGLGLGTVTKIVLVQTNTKPKLHSLYLKGRIKKNNPKGV